MNTSKYIDNKNSDFKNHEATTMGKMDRLHKYNHTIQSRRISYKQVACQSCIDVLTKWIGAPGIVRDYRKSQCKKALNEWVRGCDKKEKAVRTWLAKKITVSEDGALMLHGDLYLGSPAFDDLTHLPDHLWLTGDLWLIRSRLSGLPKGIRVNGVIHAIRTKLKYGTDGMQVRDCQKELDEWMTACGEEEIETRRQIAQKISISDDDGLVVDGDLDLREYGSLTSLPKGLHIRGDLWVTGSGLTRLPECLIVDEDVRAKNSCLEHLSNHLIIWGRLDATGSPIASFPDCVFVRAGITIRENELLTTIPSGTRCGSLILTDCPNIRELQEGMQAGSYLNINGCSRLTALPNSVVYGVGQPRISAERTGLSAELMALYNDLQNQHSWNGARFEFSITDSTWTSVADASDIPDLLIKLGLNIDKTHRLWAYCGGADASERGSQWNNFAIFLKRLLELKTNENRELLKEKVRGIIDQMETEYTTKNSLQECKRIAHILNAADIAVGTCEDKIKIGYAMMQLCADEKHQETIKKILTFIEEVRTFKMLYDQSKAEFVPIELLLAQETELKKISDYAEVVAMDARYQTAVGELIAKRPESIRAFVMGDPAEDTLRLIYKMIPCDEMHQIEMRWPRFCTFKEEKVLSAAQKHIESRIGSDSPLLTNRSLGG